MMKKSISWMVFLLLMTAACAQAAPQLTNVTADGESLHAGEGWTVSFETTEGGALAMQLRGTEGETVDLGATQVDAGSGQLVWDGVLPDGSEAADGVYTVAVQLRNYWGEESEESLLPLTIGETNAAVSGGSCAPCAPAVCARCGDGRTCLPGLSARTGARCARTGGAQAGCPARYRQAGNGKTAFRRSTARFAPRHVRG